MNNSENFANPDEGFAPSAERDFRPLTVEESEQVSAGLWPLVIGIAIGCALLLAHD
jgi:hypothetical protein